VSLQSFSAPVKAAVIGASGGIGRAFAEALAEDPAVASVFAFTHSRGAPQHEKIRSHRLDLGDEPSIAAAADTAREAAGSLDLVIVATGILHGPDGLEPEKSWRQLDAAAMRTVFALNTIGPALVAKHFLPLLPRKERGIFAALSARVGSIGDNELGGWHSYRASKAALNMLLRNFAIEQGRRNKQSVIVGLHPGTVDTGLSEPFQGGVPEGKLFTPADAALRLLAVLDGLDGSASGGVFAYDGERLPY
jgi:NAD(P)-dependent dehydrogenase (short-subunit alcohol dehydrogenase family)